MAAKKAKGSSFSKSNTKAGTAAYNTANKVKIAKKELEAKKKEIKATGKEITRNTKNYNKAKSNSLRESYGSNVEYYMFDKLPKQKAERGKISQNVSDRSRSASRAAGIAKRVAKKGK
jgi:hypothetical protein